MKAKKRAPELWLARDANGEYVLFDHEPSMHGGVWCEEFGTSWSQEKQNGNVMPSSPPLRKGRCMRVRIVAAESEG